MMESMVVRTSSRTSRSVAYRSCFFNIAGGDGMLNSSDTGLCMVFVKYWTKMRCLGGISCAPIHVHMSWLVEIKMGNLLIVSLLVCFMSVGMGDPSSSNFHVPIVVWSMMGSSKITAVLLGS